MNVTWSHSSLKEYETCARKYHETRVLKLYPREETEQSLYGTRLHEAAELYLRDGKPLTPEFAFLKPTLDALARIEGRKLCEYEMALTQYLQPCNFKAPNFWVRGIADLIIVNDENFTASIFDYKSGSAKYPDQDQLILMSLMVFAHFPHIRHVRSALLFVLHDRVVRHTISRDEADAHWWKYRERVGRLEASTQHGVWNPKQNGLCRKYCPVVTCEHNGRRS